MHISCKASPQQYHSWFNRQLSYLAGNCADIFRNRHGAQGPYDTASHAMLDNEFGTHKDEDVIIKILEKGTIQETTVSSLLTVLGFSANNMRPREYILWS